MEVPKWTEAVSYCDIRGVSVLDCIKWYKTFKTDKRKNLTLLPMNILVESCSGLYRLGVAEKTYFILT